MTGMRIPAGPGESELTEKRSRFLGHLREAVSEEEARAFIREMQKEYHDARHNCWCWRLSSGAERFSDDGEPQGSAGKPMLEVFRHEEVTNLVCVVTRYFGGVLLGTGGLARAYSGAAKEALLAAGIKMTGHWREVRFHCPYSLLERCRKLLAGFGGEESAADYGEDAAMTALLPAEQAETFQAALTEMSGGKISSEVSGIILR